MIHYYGQIYLKILQQMCWNIWTWFCSFSINAENSMTGVSEKDGNKTRIIKPCLYATNGRNRKYINNKKLWLNNKRQTINIWKAIIETYKILEAKSKSCFIIKKVHRITKFNQKAWFETLYWYEYEIKNGSKKWFWKRRL